MKLLSRPLTDMYHQAPNLPHLSVCSISLTGFNFIHSFRFSNNHFRSSHMTFLDFLFTDQSSLFPGLKSFPGTLDFQCLNPGMPWANWDWVGHPTFLSVHHLYLLNIYFKFWPKVTFSGNLFWYLLTSVPSTLVYFLWIFTLDILL